MEKTALCFSRNIGVITSAQQHRLEKSRIAVFGLGGVGGICAEMLVRAGVGGLLVVDFDEFEITNLNRQIHATRKTVGTSKTSVFVSHAKTINSKTEIKKISKKLEYRTMGFFSRELSSFSPHMVIDTTDSAHSRVMLARICKKTGITYLYAAAMGARGMVGVVRELERILHLPSRGRPDSEIEASLIHYPQCKTAWGPAANLSGVLAANTALNYLLLKPYPRAPNFLMVDAMSSKIVRKEKLA